MTNPNQLCDVLLFVCSKMADETNLRKKKVREKSRECHNHKPQPFPDPKRKRKPTNLNKHKPNKRTKSTKISSLFPKRGNRNTKRTEKHKNKMTHGKTYNKSPRRINHKATKSKTNTGTTALERSVEQTTGGFKALLQLANFTLGPDALNCLLQIEQERSEEESSVGDALALAFRCARFCSASLILFALYSPAPIFMRLRHFVRSCA